MPRFTVQLTVVGVARAAAAPATADLRALCGQVPPSALTELHGNVFRERCRACGREFLRGFDVTEASSYRRHTTMRKCDDSSCRAPLHDTIVYFGEKIDEARRAYPHIRRAARVGVPPHLSPGLSPPDAARVGARGRGSRRRVALRWFFAQGAAARQESHLAAECGLRLDMPCRCCSTTSTSGSSRGAGASVSQSSTCSRLRRIAPLRVSGRPRGEGSKQGDAIVRTASRSSSCAAAQTTCPLPSTPSLPCFTADLDALPCAPIGADPAGCAARRRHLAATGFAGAEGPSRTSLDFCRRRSSVRRNR